jgi:hypothetical protein
VPEEGTIRGEDSAPVTGKSDIRERSRVGDWHGKQDAQTGSLILYAIDRNGCRSEPVKKAADDETASCLAVRRVPAGDYWL